MRNQSESTTGGCKAKMRGRSQQVTEELDEEDDCIKLGKYFRKGMSLA